MSEFQYVAFRAIDAPVSAANLKFMERQSTRAEITPWRFDNEYHYGDFRGDAVEMLRRGYDLFLHYANYGIRDLYIRLPQGLPSADVSRRYLDNESLTFEKDPRGKGGILKICPQHEPGDLDELWDLSELVDRLVGIRAEILAGDLRPLYLARLAVLRDYCHDPEESIEGPVPAGLSQLTDAQLALTEFFGIDIMLATAAARGIGAATGQEDRGHLMRKWLDQQSAATMRKWLLGLMEGEGAEVRAELLAAFQNDQPVATWPVTERGKSLAELMKARDEIAQAADARATAKAARERAKLLAEMAKNPQPHLTKVSKLVEVRSTDSYEKAADLLSDLREALAKTGKSKLAEDHANHLHLAHPKLHFLTSALRRRGFLQASP